MNKYTALLLILALCLSLSSGLEIKKHLQEHDAEEEHQQASKPPKDPRVTQTSSFGGPGGQPFDDYEITLSKVKKIIVYSGSWIDGIQFESENGQLSKVYGGEGGIKKEWVVPENQRIKQVLLRYGYFIDQLQFVASNGAKSPKFGGKGGVAAKINIPAKYKIVGFFGAKGQFLDHIGFNIAPNKQSGPSEQ